MALRRPVIGDRVVYLEDDGDLLVGSVASADEEEGRYPGFDVMVRFDDPPMTPDGDYIYPPDGWWCPQAPDDAPQTGHWTYAKDLT
jgi:hypothetical protein